uniref:Uncharacterized protein n=1 Tax=Ananas comosus var. bracteatus TaxID=296719 RepID=A0A6V7NJ94_ANACO|nr:unnamed protein product [Ananas comosus var. bracteatus]
MLLGPSTFHLLHSPYWAFCALRDQSPDQGPVPESSPRYHAFGNRSLPERPVLGRPVPLEETGPRELISRDLANFGSFSLMSQAGTGPSPARDRLHQQPRSLQLMGPVSHLQRPVPESNLSPKMQIALFALADSIPMHFLVSCILGFSKAYQLDHQSILNKRINWRRNWRLSLEIARRGSLELSNGGFSLESYVVKDNSTRRTTSFWITSRLRRPIERFAEFGSLDLGWDESASEIELLGNPSNW